MDDERRMHTQGGTSNSGGQGTLWHMVRFSLRIPPSYNMLGRPRP